MNETDTRELLAVLNRIAEALEDIGRDIPDIGQTFRECTVRDGGTPERPRRIFRVYRVED